MRTLKLLLILSVLFMSLPARAADKAVLENTEAQKEESSPERAERPKREAVKMSPTIRVSPSRPDDNGKMRRVVPARGDSPLLNMPAPKDMSPPLGAETPDGR